MAGIPQAVLDWAGLDVRQCHAWRSSIARDDGQSSVKDYSEDSSFLTRGAIDRDDIKSVAFYFGPLVPADPAPSDTYLKPENHPTATVRILSMHQKEAKFPSFDQSFIFSLLKYVGKLLESPYFRDSVLSNPNAMDVLGMSCSQIVNMLMTSIVDYVAPFTLSDEDKSKISRRIQDVANSASSSEATSDLSALYVGDVIACDENNKVVSFFFYMEAVVRITQSGKTEFQQRTIYLYPARFPLDSQAVIRDAQKLTSLEQLSVDDFINSHNS